MKIFNTLTREKETLRTIKQNQVKLYTCGPTVYHYAHLGNLRAFTFYDVLRRTLIAAGYEVTHVMNITDVGHLTDDADYGQDKLEKGAAREGKNVWEVADYYTQEFLRDMSLLNNLPPTHQPKATEYIAEQIEMIKSLEQKDFTYRTELGVAFDTSKFSKYSEFSRMPLDKLCEGARIELDPQKRNPTDFYLWKFSKPEDKRQMEWEAPWGTGFPGWHIECSAMAKALLGETIDIHCGGIDHITVHHTNEIAQSEAANGVPFANYWMHNNFLTVSASMKMSKSTENFLRMQTIVDQGIHPLSYRYMCLSANYRSELLFGWEQLESSQQALKKLFQYMYGHAEVREIELALTTWQQEFVEAMEDDLDTPRALAVMHAMLDSELSEVQKRAHLVFFDKYLGLGLFDALEVSPYFTDQELGSIIVAGASLEEQLRQRDQARLRKDWAESDKVRDQVRMAGYEVEDSEKGSRVPRGLWMNR